jgi:hypothetical protein
MVWVTDKLTTGESPGLADGIEALSVEEEGLEVIEGGRLVEVVVVWCEGVW